jgi:hypothetical protein
MVVEMLGATATMLYGLNIVMDPVHEELEMEADAPGITKVIPLQQACLNCLKCNAGRTPYPSTAMESHSALQPGMHSSAVIGLGACTGLLLCARVVLSVRPSAGFRCHCAEHRGLSLKL